VKLKVVDSSVPTCGNALNAPNSGGPFVVTRIDAEESPQDKVKIIEELDGSILPLITKFITGLLPTGTVKLRGDRAAAMRRNEVLLATVHVETQIALVVTSPLMTNLFCGFTYVTD